LNSFITAACTRVESPYEVLAADELLADGEGLALGLVEAWALADGLTEALALGLGSATILAVVLAVLVALADGLALSDAPVLGVALVLGVAPVLGVALVLGLAVADGLTVTPVYGWKSSTCRKFSSAVVLTRATTCGPVFPGTDTVMMSLP
jgi:hypothetical protein